MESTPLSISLNGNEYKLESEGKSFSIKISLSSNITIEIYELGKMQGAFYTNEFSLDTLIGISKGFRVCETIKEAYEILQEILEAKKSTIKMKENNSVVLIIEIGLPGGKTQKAELSLIKNEINKDILVEELIKKVNILEEENKKLKEEINEIKEWKKKIKKLFQYEIKKKENEKMGFESNIIDKSEDLKFLINRLINNDSSLKEKNINFNLLYRATRDGDNFNDFHSRVDNKNSTLTIIKTDLGCKFGVFLEVPFKQINNEILDDKSFIFSLDLKKIYNSKSGTVTLNDDNSKQGMLLNLCCQPILIYINFLSNSKSFINTASYSNKNYSGFEKDYELNNNKGYFQVVEMETFQINFN